MPRYLFRVTDGQQVLQPPRSERFELPGNAAAREEALMLARDLKHGGLMPQRNWDGWFVKILDQHGHEVDAVPIADAPERS